MEVVKAFKLLIVQKKYFATIDNLVCCQLMNFDVIRIYEFYLPVY